MNERKYLSKRTSELRRQIKNLPEGDLSFVRNGTYVKWYRKNGKNPIYIPKKQKKYAEELALKKYYSLQLEQLTEEMKIVDCFIEDSQNYRDRAISLLEDDFCYKPLLQPYFESHPNKIQMWLKEKYVNNTRYPEALKHPTLFGQKVRSKSEAFIGNALYRYKIPFRYECALEINGITFFPDFTIFHPKTGQIIYWEHFGRMDELKYCKKACYKLQVYCGHGIIPGINLITTYETLDYPADSSLIEKIVMENLM